MGEASELANGLAFWFPTPDIAAGIFDVPAGVSESSALCAWSRTAQEKRRMTADPKKEMREIHERDEKESKIKTA